MTEPGGGSLRDIVLHLLPCVLFIPNSFAVATNRQESLQMADVLTQIEHSFGHLQAGGKLIGVEGFRHEIICSCFHSLKIICLSRLRREQEENGVIVAARLVNQAAKGQAVQFWHQPVGNQDRNMLPLVGRPGLAAVFRNDDIVALLFQRRF